MRNATLASICIGLFAHAADASAVDLSGTLTDLNGNPLHGAVVLLARTDTATGTDAQGGWKFAGTVSGRHGDPSVRAPNPLAREIVLDGSLLRVRYAGLDASGRMRSSWTPPALSAALSAERLAVGAAADTIRFSWNGRIRAGMATSSLTAGAMGAVKIDTATVAGDIRWSTREFKYGKLTDPRDGQVYRTIAIGSQIWMAENLNFKVDSSARPLGSADSVAKYGRLYQWAAAMGLSASYNKSKWGGPGALVQGACPVGWHVPSSADWATLKTHIDPAGVGVGSKLRSIGGWRGFAVSAASTDSFGFRSVPAGILCCGDFAKADSFKAYGTDTRWWSATEGSTATVAGTFSNAGAGTGEKGLGYSLRCLKDSAALDPYADVKLLAKDVGGVSTQVPKGTKTKPVNGTPDSATYGYYVYLPSGATDTSKRFPMVVSVHGSGFSEDAGLDAQLGLGIHYLIANGKWKPNYPFVVASPQNHADNGWNSTELNNYIAYMVAHYPVDPKRVYLVGMSMGAMGIYNYLTSMGAKSLVAAAVPIAGTSGTANVKNVSCPVWAFHGAKDANVSPTTDKAFIAALQAAHPQLDVKITMFTNLAHEWNIWYYPYYQNSLAEETATDGRTDIDPAFAPYNRSIYDWMLLHRHP